MHWQIISSKIMLRFFFNFLDLVINLSSFHILVPVMVIFCIYSPGYSSIRTNKTILPVLFLKSPIGLLQTLNDHFNVETNGL